MSYIWEKVCWKLSLCQFPFLKILGKFQSLGAWYVASAYHSISYVFQKRMPGWTKLVSFLGAHFKMRWIRRLARRAQHYLIFPCNEVEEILEVCFIPACSIKQLKRVQNCTTWNSISNSIVPNIVEKSRDKESGRYTFTKPFVDYNKERSAKLTICANLRCSRCLNRVYWFWRWP